MQHRSTAVAPGGRPEGGGGGGGRGPSAGILLFRRPGRRAGIEAIEILLVHPGGPFWATKDEHAWSIPKGELEDGESPFRGALREFAEETGATVGAAAQAGAVALPPIRTSGGKVIHAFAVEQDFEVTALRSSLFELEWPPRSGRNQTFPEVDRAAWFPLELARSKLHKGQAGLVDHLVRALEGGGGAAP
jgi:predicted NUDIX family NTP pyrophosphohydrolase